jgi:CRISPR-associated protein Csm5
MTTYKLTLRTLSPVHIGSGDEWRLGFDFVLHNGHTWIFNEDAILQAKWEQLGLDQPVEKTGYPLLGSLLTEKDLEHAALFRYVLRGQPPSIKADARMKPFIKDPFDRPYIPGSSLKGAFRTALAWTGWKEIGLPPLKRNDIGNNRNWAGKPLESKIFGRDPNHDLLRALQVSDLFGPKKAGEGLVALKAQVLTQKAAQSPIGLESLAGDVEFFGSLTIDQTLFQPIAAKLGFSDRKHWLDQLIQRAQQHSQARLKILVDWFENITPPAPSAEKIAAFYRQLQATKLSSGQALMQIGWGTGWDGKTFWTHLQKDEFLFEKLIADFRMDRAGRHSRRQPGDPFPSSRRVVMSGKKDEAKPVAPFGWVLITIEPQDVSNATISFQTTQTISSPAKPSVSIPSRDVQKTPVALPKKSIPSSVQPPAKPMVEVFKTIPKIGDRFSGIVFSDYKGEIWLSIPGLDEDTQAYAVILRNENPLISKVKDGDTLECQVVERSEESKGYWRVKCKLG